MKLLPQQLGGFRPATDPTVAGRETDPLAHQSSSRETPAP